MQLMRPSFPHPTRAVLAAMPWLALACAAALGLGLSIYAAMLSHGLGLGTPTMVLRSFALVLGAVGTVRNLCPTAWRPGEVAWLGLPPRDWAFAAGFAATVTAMLWLVL